MNKRSRSLDQRSHTPRDSCRSLRTKWKKSLDSITLARCPAPGYLKQSSVLPSVWKLTLRRGQVLKSCWKIHSSTNLQYVSTVDVLANNYHMILQRWFLPMMVTIALICMIYTAQLTAGKLMPCLTASMIVQIMTRLYWNSCSYIMPRNGEVGHLMGWFSWSCRADVIG